MSVTFHSDSKFGTVSIVDHVESNGDEKPRFQSAYARRMSRRGSVLNSQASPPPDGVLVNSDRAYSVISENMPDFVDVHDEAREQIEKETSLGFFAGLKTYPKAAAWSVLLSSSIIMEGYDTCLMGAFFAYPQFNERYGNQLPDGRYELGAAWQAGLMNGALAGSFAGLALNGWLCDKIGFKKTYYIGLALMTAAIFLPFFASGVPMLMAGQVISGIPWGMFQTLSVAYASEVCPTCLRGYLTTYANICWVIGQVLASGILRGFLDTSGQWSYRIPFALQWIASPTPSLPIEHTADPTKFIPPIFIGLIFAHESPWWLVRNGHMEEAAVVIKRLMSKVEARDENSVTSQLSLMKLTNEHEKALSAGTQYWDCFRGIDLRRTEVACAAWACQNLCGSAFMGFFTYFYKMAGLPTSQAFNLTLAQYALGFFGTLGSWVLMSYFGRRVLYIGGLIFLCVILVGISGVGFAPANSVITQAKRAAAPTGGGTASAQVAVNVGASWAVGSMLLLFTLVYDFTVGPICYAIVAESSSTRLRQKTILLARMTYNLNPGTWNWGAKTGLFWAGICFLCIVWCYFRLPETNKRTYNELTILFENKISARKFASTRVDALRSTSIAVQLDPAGDKLPGSGGAH